MNTPTPSTPERPYVFVVRLSGELSIKAKGTRHRFTNRLVQNLQDALRSAGIDFDLQRTWSRLFVTASSEDAGEVMTRVFGVSSISRIEHRTWNEMDDLLRLGEEIFASKLAGKTFGIKARRLERQQIPFTSEDLERALGTRLLPHSAGVNLRTPEVSVDVDVLHRDAYFYSGGIKGQGGLPLGQGGRAVALVSGGFDSVVAAWLLLRRGITLDFILCNLGGSPHRDGTLQVLKVLADHWCHGHKPRLHMVDFQPIIEELEAKCPPQMWQVILKRQMLRSAEKIVWITGGAAIVTGESVAQVSSQTLQNLAVISEVTQVPILRPLCGTNKEEIFTYARHIGSFELSAKVPEYCALNRKQPATHATHKQVREAEKDLDFDRVAKEVDSRLVLDLRTLDVDKAAARDCEIDHIPSGATVIDLRSKPAFQSWHYPEALRFEYFDALKAHASFDRGKTYLFYCEVGIKSAHLAETMREAGFTAFHFQDGLKTLVRYYEKEDTALRAVMSPVLLD